MAWGGGRQWIGRKEENPLACRGRGGGEERTGSKLLPSFTWGTVLRRGAAWQAAWPPFLLLTSLLCLLLLLLPTFILLTSLFENTSSGRTILHACLSAMVCVLLYYY